MSETRDTLRDLVLDACDTFVTRVTAEALLTRQDSAGLAVVASALTAADPNHIDWIHTAVLDVFGVYPTNGTPQRESATRWNGGQMNGRVTAQANCSPCSPRSTRFSTLRGATDHSLRCRVAVPRRQASQPSVVVAAEPALGGLDPNEVRVSERLAIGVLRIIPAVGVYEACEAAFSGGPLEA